MYDPLFLRLNLDQFSLARIKPRKNRRRGFGFERRERDGIMFSFLCRYSSACSDFALEAYRMTAIFQHAHHRHLSESWLSQRNKLGQSSADSSMVQ